jgi:hypothetical protein
MKRICGLPDQAWSGMNDRLQLLPKVTMTTLVGVLNAWLLVEHHGRKGVT